MVVVLLHQVMELDLEEWEEWEEEEEDSHLEVSVSLPRLDQEREGVVDLLLVIQMLYSNELSFFRNHFCGLLLGFWMIDQLLLLYSCFRVEEVDFRAEEGDFLVA
jgi:hypothetical protein